jgi:hypothetical protein
MATSNMSRKSRRKTLSHAEIENFLCDLGNDDETEVIKKSPSDNVMVVNVCEGSLLNDSENQTENPSSSCVAQQEEEDRQYRANVVRAFHKVSGSWLNVPRFIFFVNHLLSKYVLNSALF